MPHISFCISTYKRGNVLRETLESIKRQTYTSFEVIVADNDPDSSARPFVESVKDERFFYYPNGTNLGMKASFNRSLSFAQGEFVVMMADDDPIYPDMLETLVKLSKDHPGYGLYLGGCDWFCMDKDVAPLYKLNVGTNSCLNNSFNINDVRIFTTTEFLSQFYTFKIFKHFLWSTCIVKNDLLKRMGGIPDYGSPFLGDYAYLSIAATERGCVVINKSLGCQTIHRENFGRNQNDQLPVVAVNFPQYLNNKLSSLNEWHIIKPLMMRFVSLWILEHMAFLFHFVDKGSIDIKSLNKAEKEVFALPFMKGYKFKFYLKKNHQLFHDWLVKLKQIFSN